MLAAPLALAGLLAAPDAARPRLELPPPPPVEIKTIESNPPGARIENTLRLSLFEPWLLGGVAGLRSFSASRFALGAEARLAFPVRVYGRDRTGYGVAPTAAVITLGGLRDHASFGLALALLEERRDSKTGPSAFALVIEAALPFDRDGASLGLSTSLFFMARGPWVSLGYARIPEAGGPTSALLLKLGVNFTDLFH